MRDAGEPEIARDAGEARAPLFDRAGWDDLVARHGRRVVVSLLARGIGIARAKDIAQEAWARLIESDRHGRLDRIEMPGLAIRQADLIARDEARRGSRRGEVPIDDDVRELASAEDVEAAFFSRERLGRAEAVLASCSVSARRAFELVYGQRELSHAEAARELGLSEQRVRQTVFEVRKRMREALEADESIEGPPRPEERRQ